MRTYSLVALGGSILVATACSSEIDTTGTTTATGAGGTGTTSSHAAVVAVTGTGGAPDIGQPSTKFPAPHGSAPQVENSLGPVLAAPVIVPIVFKIDDDSTKASIESFTSKIGAGAYWQTTTSEYGVGTAVSGTPIELDEPLAPSIDDSAIQTWLAGKLNSNDPAFPVPTANTLFAIYYPAGISITLSGGQMGTEASCQSFGGYHSNITLDAAHGSLPVAYAVVPRCSHFGFLDGLDAITGPASHEYIEAVTDPLPQTTPAYSSVDNDHFYWEIVLGGGEVGDMCAQESDAFTNFPEFGFVAQRTWSNKSAKAGHSPCVPIDPTVPYFNAVPALKDNLDLGGGLTLKGVKIPVGQTKTIDVNLFSDGPTNGAWTVDAIDTAALQHQEEQLDMSFDASEGQNGQTLHLTINVLSASQYNAEVFILTSTLGDQQHRWLGIVGN